MNVSSNSKLIERNKKISQIVLYSSLALLTLGFLWSFTNPNTSQATLSYFILIPAYILVQVSIYMANKWGRSPRPDEIIVNSLKGLNNQYYLFNYTTDVPHLLVGPAGIWIIKPYHHSGEISYNSDKKRYEQKGGPGFITKLFAQESLPNIERESKMYLADYQSYMQKNHLAIERSPQVVNLFFSEKAQINAKNAPELCIHADKFKEYLRQAAKKISLSDEEIKRILDQIPKSTD